MLGATEVSSTSSGVSLTEAEQRAWNEVRDYQAKHPSAHVRQACEATKVSVHTFYTARRKIEGRKRRTKGGYDPTDIATDREAFSFDDPSFDDDEIETKPKRARKEKSKRAWWVTQGKPHPRKTAQQNLEREAKKMAEQITKPAKVVKAKPVVDVVPLPKTLNPKTALQPKLITNEASAVPVAAVKMAVWDLVINDMRGRDQEVQIKDGEHKSVKGRNALVSAYQEALDLAMYLRQAIEEQAHKTGKRHETSYRSVREDIEAVKNSSEQYRTMYLRTLEKNGFLVPFRTLAQRLVLVSSSPKQLQGLVKEARSLLDRDAQSIASAS